PQLRQLLDAKCKAYDEAVNSNDAAAVAANYTEDGVFVTDAGPVYGRQAIEKWHADSFQQWPRKNHISKADQYSPHIIGTAGNEVWSNGEWSTTMQGKNPGDPIQLKGGYWASISVREGDTWKDLTRDSYNS
ncbi:MAG: nuclear transport factor 2 family protein, partial [Methyloceanibacter sp.]